MTYKTKTNADMRDSLEFQRDLADMLLEESKNLQAKLATLEEVRKAAQEVWAAGMITISEMVDYYRAKSLGEALEKASKP